MIQRLQQLTGEAVRRVRNPIASHRQGPTWVFLQDFFKKPGEVGYLVPSSRWLEHRIARTAELDDARVVVELGPGTGGTSKVALDRMPRDATLLALEINPRFAQVMRDRFDDPRLIVEEEDALRLPDLLERHGLGPPDAVLSGIPFSTMPRPAGRRILRLVRDSLAPGGRFVAYQFRDRVSVLGREIFGKPSVQLEVRNMPPMRVYRWDKERS